MRIALIIERLDPTRGGRERSTAEIAQELARRGHAVDVLCMSGSPIEGGVNLVPLPVVSHSRAGRLRSFVRAVQGRLVAEHYDVSHAMLPVPGASVYQLRGGTLPGLREAYLRQRRGPGRWWARAAWPWNRGRACLAGLERQVVADRGMWLLPVSQMIAQELLEYYGRVENVRVVYNAVSPPIADDQQRQAWRAERRRQWGVGQDETVFFSAAMNFQLKAGAEMCRAFARFRQTPAGRNARLAIACQDGGRSFGPGVFAIGRVDDVWPLYAAADAVVLLSWYDACSRVVLEAVSMGTPCITTRFNGAAEVLSEGAGVVVDDPADQSAVVAAMKLLSDPAERSRLAEQCRLAAPHLTMRRHVDELLEVYQEIAR